MLKSGYMVVIEREGIIADTGGASEDEERTAMSEG